VRQRFGVGQRGGDRLLQDQVLARLCRLDGQWRLHGWGHSERDRIHRVQQCGVAGKHGGTQRLGRIGPPRPDANEFDAGMGVQGRSVRTAGPWS